MPFQFNPISFACNTLGSLRLISSAPRQTDGGARGGRNAFLAAGETELLAGRRLHGDARNIDGGNFGDACAHLVTPGADLRALADQRHLEIGDTATARGHAVDGIFQELMGRGALPLRITWWK